MLYPEKLVFVNVMFGTCLMRSGPPAVCVAVNCSWDSAVIEIGMFCTSPPIFDDVTVTVSSEAGAAWAAASWMLLAASCAFSLRSEDARKMTTVLPEWCTINPVPESNWVRARSGDISPETPLVRVPPRDCEDMATGMPACAEYTSNAADKVPAGMLKFSADAGIAIRKLNEPTKAIVEILANFLIGAPLG